MSQHPAQRRARRTSAPTGLRARPRPDPETLLSLASLVSSLMRYTQLTDVVDECTKGLQRILECDAVLTWLYNPVSHRYILSSLARNQLLWPSDDRETLQSLQIRSGEALAGRVVSDGVGRMLTSSDAYRAAFGALGRRRETLYARLKALLPADFRVLAVPLISHTNARPLGVIELMTADTNLRSTDLGWLRRYADQIAELLKLVQGQMEAQKQRQRLVALDSVVTAISTAVDLPELLQMTLLVMIEIVGASGGAICTTDPGESTVVLEAQYHVPPDEWALLNSTQAALAFSDVLNFSTPTLRSIIGASDTQTDDSFGRAALPLLAGGTTVGVLLLYGPLAHLSTLDWSAMVAVCSQIGIAIANTRLYQESQRERQRLGIVIDSIADGVAICNELGELILANQAAAMMINLSSLPVSARERTARNLHGEPLEAADMPLTKALHGEVFHDYRLIMDGAQDPDRVFSFSGAPLRGSALDLEGEDAPNGAVVVFRDITEQRRLDEAKDEFLAVAAHELRSPLAAIKGYSDLLLRRELKKGDESRDLRGHQILNQQVNVLVQLVDNLLDVSRIDAGRFMLQSGVVDLNVLVESVVVQIRSTATQHTVNFEPAPDRVVVWGDELRLRQVITNLMTNAIRYSPVNTQTWVRVHTEDGLARLTFDDEGPGIPPAQREHLFARYFRVPGIKRTGSSTEGLGLGLYLCREIISLHEGAIWVESAPTGGARFQVTLPLQRVQSEFEALLTTDLSSQEQSQP